MSENSLAVRFDETEKIANAMVKSGYFQDSKDVFQAIVKIQAGREMGFGAFASMTGVYIIQGRPSVGANLMASAVKRSGRYDYRVNQMTDTGCEIEFFQGSKSIGRSVFTAEDARKAGTKNLDKFPRNMLFARAMSNGVRWYCPDVFDGAPVYTPEELGANVNEAGEVVDYTPPTVTVYVEPEPAKVEAKAPALTDWPKPVLDHFIVKYQLKAPNQARNMLNLSDLPKDTALETLNTWVELYKGFRDVDGNPYTPQEAAKLATEQMAQPAA